MWNHKSAICSRKFTQDSFLLLREELINPNVSGSCENIAHLTEINKLNEDLLKQRSTEIRYLQAKVKILATIGFTEKDVYDFTKGDKDKIYDFIYNTFKNYRVKRPACNISVFIRNKGWYNVSEL